MKRLALHTLIAAGLTLGLGVSSSTGCVAPPNKAGEGGSEAAAAGSENFVTMDMVDDSLNAKVTGDRYQITYGKGDMWKGAAAQGPLVTIVEYSDFQCPYCSRLTDTLKQLAQEYPEDVRIVFKHFPLPMHKDAGPASEAVLAAHAQGKGWELHDLVFQNARKLSTDDLIQYAEQVGVPDMQKFRSDLENHTYGDAVGADTKQGQQFGVGSTPSFFINGRPQRGAMALDGLKKLVEEEKAFAEELIKAGAKREEVYARIMRAAKTTREAPKRPEGKKPTARPGQPDPAANYAVPVDDRPAKGPETALVTIVEYSDFECPFCSKVLPTVSQIAQEYPEDVRIVFRQQPLPMHQNAKPAALAALAAHKQGKFWEMHDALFAKASSERGSLGKEGVFSELAAQLSLDVAKFEADMKDPALATMIEEDQKVASQFGANGTPAFFVNGRYISGAQPFEAFKAVIEEEKAKAQKFMAEKKLKPEEVYNEMLKGWETEVKAPPVADHQRREFDFTGVPGKGNLKDPKLTIVECSDFDCPYCGRGAQLIEEIFAAPEYKDKVAFYFLNFPLPMHQNAESAHKAAIAAGNQGKFFEMHDLLFADRGKRTEQDFRDMASQLGLDVDKFIADWKSEASTQKIKDDKAVCAKYGVSGTPNFFVNGRSMRGAVPFQMAKQVLDEELAGGFEAKKAAGGDKVAPGGKAEAEDKGEKGDKKDKKEKGDKENEGKALGKKKKEEEAG
ncbi:MAG: thioredoxin domain-containing protein [Myxococcales bacterium]|nr:thioredoxin domain-containing protein [Myxococcales bacterium]